MPAFFIAVSLRSLALAALAGLAMVRVRSAATRHAVWTLVTAGMLTVAMAMIALPPVPVRVIAAAPRPASTLAAHAVLVPARSLPKPSFVWEPLVGALYALGFAASAGRLVYGYRLTRRLVRASRRIPRFAGEAVCESGCVCVPLTVGWLRPKILLPAGWDTWEPEKLEAVLVHERHHVRRGDWAIAVLAGVNRCVFWFHPLAWWLEARLKVLAEQACDDASLSQVVSRQYYAQVLVEIAAAVRAGGGRVGWEAPAMAKDAEVSMRVERILDESRQIPPAMTRGRWAVMALCAVPLVYLSAVARPTRVRAQDRPPVTQTAEPKSAPEDRALPVVQAEADAVTERLSQLRREKLMLEVQLENLNTQNEVRSASNSLTEKMADERLQALRAQLTAAREIYTQQHPSIRRLQNLLVAEEEERVAIAARDHQDGAMDAVARQLEAIESRITAYDSGPQMESRARALEQLRELEKQLDSMKRGRGSVQLTMTFLADGRPEDIRVIRGLGPGQDERAIEWAKSLRFVPPSAPAVVTVEVPFPLK